MRSIIGGCLVGVLAAASMPLGSEVARANATTAGLARAAVPYAASSVPIRLQNRRSGKCLEVGRVGRLIPFGGGARVQQWKCSTTPDHMFSLDRFDVSGAQQWELVIKQFGPGTTVYYALKSTLTRKCLEVDQTNGGKAPGTRVLQWTCHDGDQQQWIRHYKGGGYYQYENRRSGLCLEVDQSGADAGRNDGTGILQWTCHRGPQQQWIQA
ncbi:RICIN domain-containing protein [Streptosporangiaceae bacterium NEAU-GS5]|nr:RICIN domain-containing protein [Streptosporangiaceae bacterium NEAU-GS5]